MKKKKWLKNKLAALAIAFSSVEKNSLSQGGEKTPNSVSHTRRSTEGQLMDSLLNGVVTEEVMNLRWRMYKTLGEMDKYITKITGTELDEDGDVRYITETRLKDLSNALSQVTVEPTDDYPVELVVDNSEITVSIKDAMNGIESENDYTPLELIAGIKTTRPIQIEREHRPKFDLESYTTKLHVRTINETEKLLEFYVSKYPDEFNRTTRLFLGEVKKAMTDSRLCNMLELKKIGFITFNSVGADNHLEYQYEIVNFDKIVEFNGEYVIKFKAKVLVNGENILTKYLHDELENKYKNKERR